MNDDPEDWTDDADDLPSLILVWAFLIAILIVAGVIVGGTFWLLVTRR